MLKDRCSIVLTLLYNSVYERILIAWCGPSDLLHNTPCGKEHKLKRLVSDSQDGIDETGWTGWYVSKEYIGLTTPSNHF
jgi:hypothetical protein